METPSSSLVSVAHSDSPGQVLSSVDSDIKEVRGLMLQLAETRRRRMVSRTPPANYVCHICFQPGHFIQDCPQGLPHDEGVTPYQGVKRCFGEFQCPKCKSRWTSSNSWANIGQTCFKCNIVVFPEKQRPLLKRMVGGLVLEENGPIQPFCEVCLAHGYFCRLPRQ